MWTITTIALCLWAIALEHRLKRRDKDVIVLLDLCGDVADGRTVITRKKEGGLTAKPNRGVK